MQIQVEDLFSLALREKQLWRNGFGMQALEIGPKTTLDILIGTNL